MSNQIISSPLSLFGADSLVVLVKKIKSSGFQRVLITADSVSAAGGSLQKVSSLLAKSRIVYQIFDRIGKNASVSDTRAAIEASRAFRPDVILSVGSRAVFDVSKAVSTVYTNPSSADSFKAGGKFNPEKKCLPHYQIFSSPGNAWDASNFFILEDESQRKKIKFASENSAPDGFVFDSALTALSPSADFQVSAAALVASAVDCISSTAAWILSENYALSALSLIFENASSAAKNDAKAKEAVFFAQYLLGLSFGGYALTTSVSLALEALTGESSALFSAVILPQIMNYNLPSSGEKYKKIAVALGQKISAAASPEVYRKSAVSAVEKFFKELSVPKKIKIDALSKADISFLQDTVLKSDGAGQNPKKATKKFVADLAKSLF